MTSGNAGQFWKSSHSLVTPALPDRPVTLTANVGNDPDRGMAHFMDEGVPVKSYAK